MASRYIANTTDEQKTMLGVIGAGALEDLLVKIPAKARGFACAICRRPTA